MADFGNVADKQGVGKLVRPSSPASPDHAAKVLLADFQSGGSTYPHVTLAWHGSQPADRRRRSHLPIAARPQPGQEPSKRMSRGYSFRDLHASRVLVELGLGGRCVTVEGIGEYDRGELRVPIKDPGGDFVVILHDATWNGEITKTAEGDAFLIRIHHEPQG